ncbi:hypothetical protein F441_19461 [Phytophthora nicotianae CJ01A1]|uniref:Tc1-like transposase DDE domain-containing protein n=3 Tax=Phytophthora nicotianae TaxID=4792 RepID=W2VZ81_PHYNI|nr:hypothetical protein F441_19461 [Phytophthora nicotianae CJ01A1]
MQRRHQLSPEEKTLVCNVYDYFVAEAKAGRSGGQDSRHRTKEATRFGKNTVYRVLRARNLDPDTNSVENAPSTRGRKKLYEASDLNIIVREYVTLQNKAVKPVTAQLICDHVESVLGKCYNVRTMRVWLNDMGFKHLRGQSRHYLAESTGNVAFRATYLQKRLGNRDALQHPIQPQFFLDESYCNVNHVTGKTWLTEEKIRLSKSGRGASSNKKVGTGGDDDYHGNFDAALFEKWFTKLCMTLQQYGNCIIHMDGASYHKRQEDPAPTRRTTKAAIQSWLFRRKIDFEPSWFIPQLLELVKAHKTKPSYVAARIAREHNHTLLYTPPYHPELQSIELIWGRVKNRIARRPADNLTDLSAKLTNEFERIKYKHWCKYYRRVLRFERKYMAALEECELVDEEELCAEADEEDEE